MDSKTFIIDTNILLYDPEAIFKFADNKVVIPVTVLEELDRLKRVPGDLGKNSRAAVRILDSLKDRKTGSLHTGVATEEGPTISVVTEYKNGQKFSLSLDVEDNKIIMAGYLLKERGENVVFVSKDLGARVKAESIGLEAEDYENYKISYESLPNGIRRIDTNKSDIDQFYKNGSVKIEQSDEFFANDYCILTSPENSSAVGRYNPMMGQVEPLLKIPHIWGIKPKNVEQRCALDLLIRDDVPLVCLTGQAGTGKTLLALAAGLRKVFDEGKYSRILISRPIIPLGRDIGYLPGTKEEKLFHWMQPIYDNLEFLCDSLGNEPSETLKWVTESKKLEMEAVTYIRGRTLPKMYIIIDEAQNLTPHEVKTIISRAGENTKVVMSGDPSQIDNPYLDKDSNGLTYTIGKFIDRPVFGHIALDKTERSPLAALAADLM